MRAVLVAMGAVIILQAVAIVGLNNLATSGHDKQTVYEACNTSRTSDITLVSEDTCGYLQDKFNMEFMCKANNDRKDNHCWVEVK